MKKMFLSFTFFTSFFALAQDLTVSLNELKEKFIKLSDALEGKVVRPVVTGEIPVVFIFEGVILNSLKNADPSNPGKLKTSVLNELKNLNSRIAFKDYTYDEFMANPVYSSYGLIINILRGSERLIPSMSITEINKVIDNFDIPANILIVFALDLERSFQILSNGNLNGKLTKNANNFTFYLPYKARLNQPTEYLSFDIKYDFASNKNMLEKLKDFMQSIA